MYTYYLAIGSNLGQTNKNLDKAIKYISNNKNIEIVTIAPYYFNPPLLPHNASEDYYHIFCNTCITIKSILEPLKLLYFIKQLENKMGRAKEHFFWAPRTIDIDILCCFKNNKCIHINTKELVIPHKELFNRSFVLDPLSHLNSKLTICGKKILYERKKLPLKQPAIMGIVNITNDSFSGDGSFDVKKNENKIKKFIKHSIPIIDIGCEATNKNTKEIETSEEIERLKSIIHVVKKYKQKTFSTKFSIDTYRPKTALFAIENGFDIINDVNGFKNKEMWQIMQKYKHIEGIIMHSLHPHANNKITITTNNIITEMQKWVDEIKNKAIFYSIDESRIIIDYGIGFGKTAFQSLQILQNLDKIKHYNFRVMIGHSKKSFMSLFTKSKPKQRTFETIGASLTLKQKNIDIIRVHDAIELQKTILAETCTK